jgi:hypothetical protein
MGARAFQRESAALALYDVLEPFHIAKGPLHSTYAAIDNSSLALNISWNNSLNIRVEASDNTIWVMDGPRQIEGVDVSASDIWREYLGRDLTWGWLAINEKGHIDSILLSFGNVIPDICVSVAASSLKVSKLGSWQDVSRI